MSLVTLSPARHARAWLGSLSLFCGCSLDACAVYDDLRVAPVQTNVVQAPFAGASAQLMAAGASASAGSAAPPVCVPLAGDDPCERLPRLPAAPSLDGELECGLSLVSVPVAMSSSGAERSVQYAAAVSDAGLYLYVRVHAQATARHAPDAPLFCGDAVELFVDADGVIDPLGAYESSGTMQFVVAAPAADGGIEAGKFLQGKPFGPWVSQGLKVTALADGYAVEALISAADLGLWAWQPAGRLGFDLAVDFAALGPATDMICSSAREQTFLRIAAQDPPCAGQPWCDSRAFCLPQVTP